MNIVLHQPEMPANTGNIGRTCLATGTPLHLIEPLGFQLNDRALKRAGLDYWHELDVTKYDDYAQFKERHPGARVWMATTKAHQTYTDVTYGPDDYIMFGKESAGIPEEILVENEEHCIRIPMADDIRSLNLSNAVAIVLYEALRQQSFAGLEKHGELHRLSWKRVMQGALALTLAIFVFCASVFTSTLDAYAAKSGAADTQEELDANVEARKSLPVETNEIEGWPAGPEIGSEAAILMDVDTGTILYAKNIDEELYPASTTKLLTCLLAQENGHMTDMVPFSYEAVHSVPSDGSSIGMDAGQSITLEQCLYGIMVGSANEVANAVAEYTAGSIDGFTDLMNERAAELGCKHSHFTNANGLMDTEHYTSAHDLALIAREYFSNDMLARIANTAKYHFEPTDTQPDDFYLKNKHALITGEVPYEGICGGKTGFTNDSRQTLVTCCEQNGMRLICVVMMQESPNQFYDTATLFDYGYSNFSLVNVTDYETAFTTEEKSFFKTGSDIFGNSRPFLKMNPDSRIILPNNVDFDDLDTEVSYDTNDGVVQIYYRFHGRDLGSALVETSENGQPGYEFEHVSPEEIAEGNTGITIEQPDRTIFLNVKTLIAGVLGLAVALAVLIALIRLGREYHFSGKRADKKRRRSRKRRGRHGDLYV